jgi:hypothetical protein
MRPQLTKGARTRQNICHCRQKATADRQSTGSSLKLIFGRSTAALFLLNLASIYVRSETSKLPLGNAKLARFRFHWLRGFADVSVSGFFSQRQTVFELAGVGCGTA